MLICEASAFFLKLFFFVKAFFVVVAEAPNAQEVEFVV